MKILILSPHVDVEHGVVRTLQGRGHGVLVCSTAQQASEVLKLHKRTIELAFVHREDASGNGELGFEFIRGLKQNSEQSDLPFVISSASWGPSDFALHQAGPCGAHAYLPFPATGNEYLKLIEGIFGTERSTDSVFGLKLEEASSSPDTRTDRGAGAIRLDLPELPATDSNPSAATEDSAPKASVTIQGLGDEIPELELRGQFSAPEKVSAPERVEPAAGVPFEISFESPGEDVAAGASNSYDARLDLSGSPETFELADPSAAEIPRYVASSSSSFTPPAHAAYEAPLEDDPAAMREMPYLFSSTTRAVNAPSSSHSMSLDPIRSLGDAIVPGGAAHSPDVDTLKKYLLLREQDVAALSTQLRDARDQVAALEDQLRESRSGATDLQHQMESRDRRIQEFEREKELALEGLQVEINEMKFQARAKADRSRSLEAQLREAASEMERLKDRVRSDIRRIRVREKELENRLEILKKDSEALISARENKIIELKRKVDLLEFNMDLLQDQYQREKEGSAKTRDRLSRALQAVRVAGGLLDGGGNRPAAPGDAESA